MLVRNTVHEDESRPQSSDKLAFVLMRMGLSTPCVPDCLCSWGGCFEEQLTMEQDRGLVVLCKLRVLHLASHLYWCMRLPSRSPCKNLVAHITYTPTWYHTAAVNLRK